MRGTAPTMALLVDTTLSPGRRASRPDTRAVRSQSSSRHARLFKAGVSTSSWLCPSSSGLRTLSGSRAGRGDDRLRCGSPATPDGTASERRCGSRRSRRRRRSRAASPGRLGCRSRRRRPGIARRAMCSELTEDASAVDAVRRRAVVDDQQPSSAVHVVELAEPLRVIVALAVLTVHDPADLKVEEVLTVRLPVPGRSHAEGARAGPRRRRRDAPRAPPPIRAAPSESTGRRRRTGTTRWARPPARRPRPSRVQSRAST